MELTPRRPIPITISAKCFRKMFKACGEPPMWCGGACCRAGKGRLIAVHPLEASHIRNLGGIVENNLLQPRPGEASCPFQHPEGYCIIYHQGRPISCMASPFNLTKSGKIMITVYRHYALRCYDTPDAMPAYQSRRHCLISLFGEVETNRISQHLEAGGGDMVAELPWSVWKMLTDINKIRSEG